MTFLLVHDQKLMTDLYKNQISKTKSDHGFNESKSEDAKQG